MCFPPILGKLEFTIELRGFQPIVKVVKSANASFFICQLHFPLNRQKHCCTNVIHNNNMFISTFCRASVIHHKGLDGLKLGIRMIFVQAVICGNVLDLIQTDGIRKDSVWYPLLNQRSCKLSKSKWFLFSVSVYPSLIDPAAPSTPSTHFFAPNTWLLCHPQIWEEKKMAKGKNKRWWQRCGVEVWKFCQRLHFSFNCWKAGDHPRHQFCVFPLLLYFYTFRRAPSCVFLHINSFTHLHWAGTPWS